MTIHNLKEHLTWLLAYSPTEPPPSVPSVDGNLSLGILPKNGPEALPPTTNPPAHDGCLNNGEDYDGESHFKLDQPLASSKPNLSRNHEIMARLQSGPRSTTKSCLLSQAITNPLQTPKPSRNQNTNTSLRNRHYAPNEGDTSGILSLSQAVLIIKTESFRFLSSSCPRYAREITTSYSNSI